MNAHDSERVSGLLVNAGYEITTDLAGASLVVINTCSVRERAEEKLFQKLARLRPTEPISRPVIAVIGCVAQQEGERLLERAGNVDVVVGTQALRRLPILTEQALDTRQPQVDVTPYDDVSFPLGVAVRHDPVKAYVTIIEGCNDFCAFCVVPYTRGHERMRPAIEILEEARRAADQGHREIHLLGQIVNHYQAPDLPGCDFASLLERLHEIPGIERLRFASPHPRHVTPRLLESIRDLPKVCRHLHLPVQSGSTRVLNAMRRRYTRDQYLDLIERTRGTIPNIAISTDMIVGFPGESPSDFDDTLTLVEQVRYQSMFSFTYSERPNTLASKRLPDTVGAAEKSRRLAILQARQHTIQTEILRSYVGRTVAVLADSTSRRRRSDLCGRTSDNAIVNFPAGDHRLGEILRVTIQRAGPNALWGTPTRNPCAEQPAC